MYVLSIATKRHFKNKNIEILQLLFKIDFCAFFGSFVKHRSEAIYETHTHVVDKLIYKQSVNIKNQIANWVCTYVLTHIHIIQQLPCVCTHLQVYICTIYTTGGLPQRKRTCYKSGFWTKSMSNAIHLCLAIVVIVGTFTSITHRFVNNDDCEKKKQQQR